ncbi:DNA polymerase Y family protein [Terriglobus aquaticus]|uniref:DNA polymerase thumb domain-containing protein n=1 Tax=Terriglobus aquaticus TaxID=940139 RepID=A0ABW9KPS1_9BACT|nr:DNA polymerase [Terriglobus aquaticus]
MDLVLPQHDFFGFLHVDLNSFFASVEQQLNPEYRNRPLAVVPTFADTTVAIAASYEAKALGIKTGTRVADMKQICPDILLVQGNHTTYAEFSHKIHAAVERCCPVAHVPSIDEVTCQLIGREQEPPRARQIALSIKQAIRDDVGETLRCSIGMAPNRYLAKIASDMQKPDGLVGLLPSQLPRSLLQLELRDLPGVGARTELMLNRKGVTTMEQLLALSREQMHKLWNSVWGERLYHWLRGHVTGDDGAPVPRETQQSLGHSHVLAPEHRSAEGAWAVAHKLLHKAAMRLRMEHFCAGTLSLTIRYQVSRAEEAQAAKLQQHHSGIRHHNWGMEARFPATQDTLSLLEALRELWQKQPTGPGTGRPFFVGITLNRLTDERAQQPDLFRDTHARNELSRALDRLNLKHGHTTVHFAGMLPARDSAPTRIAFTQIPVQYGVDYM